MKHQVEIHVFMEYGYTADYSRREWKPDVWACKVEETERRVYVGPQTITVEVPDNFDPVPAQVAALQAEKAAMVEKHGNELANINERLSKLLSITNEVAA